MVQKVLLVDDHPLFRRGLRELLEIEDSICIIGEAENGQEAIDFVDNELPDIVVMDITMPTINGIDATKALVLKYPFIKIIALSMHSGKRFVKGMLDAGAKGYLLKDSAPSEIVSAIKKVGQNEMYISSEVTSMALSKDYGFDATPVLLKAKLYQPQLSKKFVERKNIVDFLNNHLKNPLTAVIAPTGYGKSIAISQWVSQVGFPYSWISLDKDLDDFKAFLKYLEQAIRANFPKSLARFNKLLNEAALQPINVLAYTFINEIEQLKKQVVLVLDNFQVIKNTKVKELIGELLKYCPNNLHLVICSCENLDFSINYLRLEGKVNEIGLKELRFSDFEIQKFVHLNYNLELNMDAVNKLQHTTEGWVLGLRLLTKSFLDIKNSKEIAIHIHRNGYLFEDYFTNEIFSKFDVDFMKQLQVAAILTSFHKEVLNELFIKNKLSISGSEFLEKLRNSNLFIQNLKNNKDWFQFHPLFKKALQNQVTNYIGAEDLNIFHQTAYAFFTKKSYLNEAMEHALLISDSKLISEIIIKNQVDLLNKELWGTIKSLLVLVPKMVRINSIELELFNAIFNDYLGNFKTKVLPVIFKLKAEIALLDDEKLENSVVLGTYFLLKAKESFLISDIENTLINTDKALHYLPAQNQYLRVKCLHLKAVCCQMQQDTGVGIQILACVEDLFTFNIASQARLSLALCAVYFVEGNLDMVNLYAKEALRLAEKKKLKETVNESYYVLCLVHYLRDEKRKATRYLNLMFKDRVNICAKTLVHATLIRSLIEEAVGDYGKSWKAISLVEDYLAIKEGSELYDILEAFKKDLRIKEKQIVGDEEIDFQQNMKTFCTSMSPYFSGSSKIKRLINNDFSAAAKKEIKILITYAKSVNNKYLLLISFILETYLYVETEKEKEALSCLNKALTLSEQGEYKINYDGYGSKFENLFTLLQVDLEKKPYIYSLLLSFEGKNRVKGKGSKTYVSNDSDKLSIRELEIVKYVAKGMKNKEIAKELSVSDYTIKKHLYNTFQKLNVKNRIALIQKFEKTDFLNN